MAEEYIEKKNFAIACDNETKVFPLEFEKFYEEAKEIINDGFHLSGSAVSVSKLATMLGDRRKLDAPIKRLIPSSRVIRFKNKRYLSIGDAYDVWKWRVDKDKADKEEAEKAEQEESCPELECPDPECEVPESEEEDSYITLYLAYENYSGLKRNIRAVYSQGKVYLAIEDVIAIYETTARWFWPHSKEFMFGVLPVSTIEMELFFKILWREGYFNPDFERWCKQYVRECFGLKKWLKEYDYQGKSLYIKHYMRTDISTEVYTLKFITDPFFLRYIEMDGEEYIAIEDVMIESGYPYSVWRECIGWERDVVKKYARNDDGTIEQVSLYPLKYLCIVMKRMKRFMDEKCDNIKSGLDALVNEVEKSLYD